MYIIPRGAGSKNDLICDVSKEKKYLSGWDSAYTAMNKIRHREIKTAAIHLVYPAVGQMIGRGKVSTVYKALVTNIQHVDGVGIYYLLFGISCVYTPV